MALAVLFACSSQGDALVKQAVVADFAGFANHNAHSVVDEHTTTNPGAGMDFSGEPSTQLADEPREKPQTARPECMAKPMQDQSVKAWIAQQRVNPASGCWIPFANHRVVRMNGAKDHAGSSPISLRNRSMVLAPR